MLVCPDVARQPSRRTIEARLEEFKSLASAINLEIIDAQVVNVREVKPATFLGGGHADTYIFSGDFGHDTIVSLAGGDKIHLASFRAFKGAAMSMADLKLTQSGADVVIELDLDRNGIVDNVDYDADLIPDPVSVTVENMTVAALSASDFVL